MQAIFLPLWHLADSNLPPAAIHMPLCGVTIKKKVLPKKLYLKIIKKTPDTFACWALKLYTVIKFLKFCHEHLAGVHYEAKSFMTA